MKPDDRSWMCGKCRVCRFNMIVLQSAANSHFWYCSNKSCKHHAGELAKEDSVPKCADLAALTKRVPKATVEKLKLLANSSDNRFRYMTKEKLN